MNNYIYEYWQKIKDGSIITSKWIILFYDYIVEGLKDKKFKFDSKKANKAIKFIENFCRHHEGILAPQLIKLELWQKAFISVVFGILDDDGLRQFREVFLVVSRKNGKTLIASAIAAYMAYADGEYGGKIYMIAPKLQQASICYDGFYQMVQKENELSDISKKRRTDIYVEFNNTTIQPLAFNYKKSDGLNPSMVVCDEISSWPPEQGGKQYEVIKSALGARKQPLVLNITTAGYVNGGPYDDLFKRATQFLLGNSKETRLAPFIYQIDDEEKWNDLNELQKSNPNLGVSVFPDFFINEIAVAELSLQKKAEFMTKYCNVKQNSALAWLSAAVINKARCEHKDISEFAHSYCVAGIDLSKSTDLTALSFVIEKDEQLNVFTHYWLPANKLQEAMQRDSLPYDQYVQRGILSLSGENIINYRDVYDYITSLVEQYEILPLKIGFDKYMADYLIQDLKGYGFHCDDVRQYFNLSPVIRECEGLLRDGSIKIFDNDLMAIHLADCATETAKVNDKVRLVKIQDQPNIHIDGVMSMIDALTVRQKYYEEIGEQLKNKE